MTSYEKLAKQKFETATKIHAIEKHIKQLEAANLPVSPYLRTERAELEAQYGHLKHHPKQNGDYIKCL